MSSTIVGRMDARDFVRMFRDTFKETYEAALQEEEEYAKAEGRDPEPISQYFTLSVYHGDDGEPSSTFVFSYDPVTNNLGIPQD